MAKRKYICTTMIEIEADDEDDAQMRLIMIMDEHNISWDVEEVED